MENKNFAVFILTYGRPNNVITYNNLKEGGYTGKIHLLCSDDDKELQKYKELYGDEVIVFSKNDYKGTFDIGDNFEKDNVVVFARNANFDIAKKMGYDYFLQLDDDYTIFEYKFPTEKILLGRRIKNLNKTFDLFVDFLKNTKSHCIAFGQGGDYIGGKGNDSFTNIGRKRKIMNCFFNKTDRPYQFFGRINEDVNCYVQNGKRGMLLFTHFNVSITQKQTQSNSGGLTDFYLDGGTYVKSFYTLLYNPGAVKIKTMGMSKRRIHHSVNWKNAVPVILRQKHKK